MRIKFSHSTRFISDILWCSYTWACSVRLMASTFMFVSALIYKSTVNEMVTQSHGKKRYRCSSSSIPVFNMRIICGAALAEM